MLADELGELRLQPTVSGQTPSRQRTSLPLTRAGAAKPCTNFCSTARDFAPVTVTLSTGREDGCARAVLAANTSGRTAMHFIIHLLGEDNTRITTRVGFMDSLAVPCFAFATGR